MIWTAIVGIVYDVWCIRYVGGVTYIGRGRIGDIPIGDSV